MNFPFSLPSDIATWLFPIIIVVVFILAGIILEKIMLKIVKVFLSKTKWKEDLNITKSFKGMLITFFTCLGLYVAFMQVSLAENIRETLRALFLTLIILLVTSAASRIMVAFIRLYQGKFKGMLSSISIFTNIAKLTVFTIGFLIVLQTLGISITPILTALGVGGLAVALALKDSLSNLFAGLHIIASRMIKPGDYIKLSQSEEGHVVDINWRSTVLRSLSNNEIIIPNSKVAEAVIINYSMPQNDFSVSVPIPVSYNNDLKKVEASAHAEALHLLQTNESALKGSQPSIRFSAFNDTSIVMNVSLKCKTFADHYLLRHQLLMALHSRFKADGIIMANNIAV